MNNWWNHTVFYQIYMPSFCDGNGDGRGDFKGIMSKLPYLKELGVEGIWLTPFYPSPKVDNGYDISDYYHVDPEYGTMQDFEDFISTAHNLGIRVISDIVINHTSIEHPWFLESRSSRLSEKRDWYIWQPYKEGVKPNNWESHFGGEAWELDPKTMEYYYHSFAKEQADLNWMNKEVKKAIFDMLDFWVQKGLDGFRLDVINNLTLTSDFPDNPVDEEGKQIHKYDVNQPGIHSFLSELRQHFDYKKDFFFVGEISSDNLNLIHSYVGNERLPATFNFNLGSIASFDFNIFYREIEKINELYKGGEYPTLFFSSHDMDRFASRFSFSDLQIKALLTFLMTYRGIPFLYYGDEIGMKSFTNECVEDARDIQGIIAYFKALEKNKSKDEALKALNVASRDKSRNTMQWDNSTYGGFSLNSPWISCGEAYKECNVISQMEDIDSIWNYAKRLIQLRRMREELRVGDCEISSPMKKLFICMRTLGEKKSMIVINFSSHGRYVDLPAGSEILLTTEGVDSQGGAERLWLSSGANVIIDLDTKDGTTR